MTPGFILKHLVLPTEDVCLNLVCWLIHVKFILARSMIWCSTCRLDSAEAVCSSLVIDVAKDGTSCGRKGQCMHASYSYLLPCRFMHLFTWCKVSALGGTFFFWDMLWLVVPHMAAFDPQCPLFRAGMGCQPRPLTALVLVWSRSPAPVSGLTSFPVASKFLGPCHLKKREKVLGPCCFFLSPLLRIESLLLLSLSLSLTCTTRTIGLVIPISKIGGKKDGDSNDNPLLSAYVYNLDIYAESSLDVIWHIA